jgi:hypothetical protein
VARVSVRLSQLVRSRPGVPSRSAIVGAFAAPIVALLVVTLAGCPQRREPPPPESGTVIEVNPIPGRPQTVFITVRYRDGVFGRYRVTHGHCRVDDRYPSCTEELPQPR